jgi:hypothetical protein
MSELSRPIPDGIRRWPAIPLPRTSRIIAGFLLAGVLGLTAITSDVGLDSSSAPVWIH